MKAAYQPSFTINSPSLACCIGGKSTAIFRDGFVKPSVLVGSHAVLTAGSVASKDLEPYGIYQGNPAVLVK